MDIEKWLSFLNTCENIKKIQPTLPTMIYFTSFGKKIIPKNEFLSLV